MRFLKISLFAAAAVAALAGCSTVNTYERADSDFEKNVVKDRRVITDLSLARIAHVAEIIESREGGLLKIQAKIVNRSASNVAVNYKFAWFEKNGMVLPSQSSYNGTLVLEGREAGFVSAIAPSPNVSDFTLRLLEDVREY